MFKNLLFASFLAVLALGCRNEKAAAPVVSFGQPEPIRPMPTSNYDEPHRPQFHFSPPVKWMNDPNGMFFYEGEWHLFYQHFPDSSVWGPMHWAHAVSRDLVRWENLPIALYPDSLGYIFSGSAVVDWANSSGFGDPASAGASAGKGKKPPIVAMFTYHDMKKERAKLEDVESQGIAFSNDAGRTWTKYNQNPVILNPKRGTDRDFRDPKLVFYEPSKTWICALAVGQHAEFWGSKDLKKWELLSQFGDSLGAHGGVWECPDFAPVSVENSTEKKWLLIQNLNPGGPNGGSAAQVFVGDFDGKTFRLDPNFEKTVPKGTGQWLDWGKDNYASVSFSDVPASDGRRVIIGWMSNWQYAQKVPTTAWRSAATLPREVFLRKTAVGGYRVCSRPVVELEKLRAKTVDLAAGELSKKMDLNEKMSGPATLSEIEIEFEKGAGAVGIELSNSKNETFRIGYDGSKNQFFSDRRRAGDASFSKDFASGVSVAPRFSDAKTVRLRVFFDVASAELFADDGEVAMTELFFPSEDFSKISLFSDGAKTRLVGGRAHVLKSIWR